MIKKNITNLTYNVSIVVLTIEDNMVKAKYMYSTLLYPLANSLNIYILFLVLNISFICIEIFHKCTLHLRVNPHINLPHIF